MVRTRSIYKAIDEQLSVFDIFGQPPMRKTKSASTMFADEQIATPSDLAAKVAALSDDMKTILDWIKIQSAAPSAMLVEKSGRLARTPPKARVTPMKGAFEDTSGVRDDDDSDDDGSIAPSVAEGSSRVQGLPAARWRPEELEVTAIRQRRPRERRCAPQQAAATHGGRGDSASACTTQGGRKVHKRGPAVHGDGRDGEREVAGGARRAAPSAGSGGGARSRDHLDSAWVTAVSRRELGWLRRRAGRRRGWASAGGEHFQGVETAFQPPSAEREERVAERVRERGGAWFSGGRSITPAVGTRVRLGRAQLGRLGLARRTRIEAKIEIPNYDGAVDAEKLDAWLDQLETYFDLYNYSNAEKEFYPMGYEEERWKCWHVLRQRRDQTVQDYTIDFRRQALALGISFDDPQVIDAIIDTGSQKNLILENLVQRRGLSTTPHPHPHPYPLGWIDNNIEMKIDRQCKVKFAVTGVYIDEMLCEVVPLNICNLIFGSPYLRDRDATFFRRPQQYQFIKDEQNFLFTTELLSTTVDLVTARKAKRMINVCQKFALLVIRPVISKEANNKILSLACKENTDDVPKLIREHQDLFQEIQGLPQK
uniref:Retrotransposon gag domain-containing protein n=1 Tax=Ananas comosus var. bracteatus TaxID=296719 RepID=A0A6V7NGP9_ANACO|nr:unnamed protein product [Ananas comosus var. bracteatus]